MIIDWAVQLHRPEQGDGFLASCYAFLCCQTRNLNIFSTMATAAYVIAP
jgi:hypothetical protein